MCQARESVKDVLAVNETSLKGSRQLSSPAGFLHLSEIPWKERELVLKLSASEQLNWSCRKAAGAERSLRFLHVFTFLWPKSLLFFLDSLRDGPWQKEEHGPRLNKKQLFGQREEMWEGSYCGVTGSGSAVRGLCLWSRERIHDWTPQRKVVNCLGKIRVGSE